MIVLTQLDRLKSKKPAEAGFFAIFSSDAGAKIGLVRRDEAGSAAIRARRHRVFIPFCFGKEIDADSYQAYGDKREENIGHQESAEHGELLKMISS
ncbi:hypothetical protein [Herbaspirillum robiniae]|uniref:hypothetical protein n=1 Tax=Herbaspirillum robiniae TaxID=2014887 RepID=UPI0013147CA1|nr:hypothetical protein [Herbaspirillum robiniae]